MVGAPPADAAGTAIAAAAATSTSELLIDMIPPSDIVRSVVLGCGQAIRAPTDRVCGFLRMSHDEPPSILRACLRRPLPCGGRSPTACDMQGSCSSEAS